MKAKRKKLSQAEMKRRIKAAEAERDRSNQYAIDLLHKLIQLQFEDMTWPTMSSLLHSNRKNP